MRIGIPKEIKRFENRVALTPDGLKAFIDAGHTVYIEKGAGLGAGITDDDYLKQGAAILDHHKEIFEKADMVYKVKEPLPDEYEFLREGQILYAYLHLAANKNLTRALLDRKVTGVAFETIQLSDGQLPLLEPMSEVAGRLSVQEGAKYLEKTYGGEGVLLGGVPGVARGNVVIIGGGTVGLNAAEMAVGMGANVRVLDIDKRKMQFFDNLFGNRVETLYSTPGNIERSLADADLVVCAVLIPGGSAPKLIKREHLKIMKKGAVIVDVAVDQGGCCETTHPTYHDDPIFIVDDIVHYCVANIPGAVPVTSTWALAEATLPYAIEIATKGLKEAAKDEPLLKGINTFTGVVTHPQVAGSLGVPYKKILQDDL
ncbi:MAG: alanine dehydrogenase [Thermodesulfobacteriota bacterium]|nr:alanine dehydrogenase [Thermodesulfobacteriota bacterium]